MNRDAPGRMQPGPLEDGRGWAIVLSAAAVLTALRIAALFSTPLELYPDEAQYWLWSRTLDWGYASKPPLIAWLIRLTTAVGGDGEAWVRLSAPLVHAGAMLAVYPAGRRLYGPAAGALSALLYGLMPAVQVSALFVATDAPLMLFLALALWAYVALIQARTACERRWLAAAAGLAAGVAFLAKYAAAFLVIGALLHALTDARARRAWGGWAWAIALVALLAALGPNLAWLAGHHFATVTHTAEVNAHWSLGKLFNPGKLVEFELDQFGVVGPVPLAVLILGTILLARRRALERSDGMLLCLILPAIVLVSVQALLSRAHAHWAAVSYLPGVILAAGWLVRWRARIWTGVALGIQGLVAALLLAVVAWPGLVDASGNGRRLARLRGWQTTAAIVTRAARQAQAVGGLTAVAVEDRYLFNALAYYGRDYFASPGAAPLRMRAAGPALNEAELSAPLTPKDAGRVLIAETAGSPPAPALPGDFSRLTAVGRWVLPLGGRKTREIVLTIGEGYLVHTALMTRSLPQPSR